MSYKSSIRIEYSTTGTFTSRDSAPVAIPSATSVILLDFDDEMEDEHSESWQSVGQDSLPVLSGTVKVRGRGGASKTVRFSRIIEHADIEDARQYLSNHTEGLPAGTVEAHIVHESERISATTPAAIATTRAHLDSAGGEITGGSQTRFSYSLRWEIGA